MVLTIREASVEDAETISRLAIHTFYESYSWYNTRENMEAYTQLHFDLAQTKKELLDPGNYFFLAEADGETVGYVKLRNIEHPPELQGKKYIEIERIYVEQRFQKYKIGYALIQKCIEKAREKDLDIIWLGVWEKNDKAIAFYERAGFKKFGWHNFQFGDDLQVDHLFKFDLK